ncbi:hypothetical protein [Rhodoferax antarcticus]|uniref:hypothetical protein n=1 Tax=Rhodoferax antarcticus TaxID=81479 RepID=UPI00222475E1|nr:hypothetical protein [Rhodoferax antarcticus]MCW2313543.1 hypothetical protein [Rhodoferax antarcticus]
MNSNDTYYSVNDGFSVCAKYFSGLYAVNDSAIVNNALITALKKESDITQKNNIYFLIDGLNHLDKEVFFEFTKNTSITYAAFKSFVENAPNIVEFKDEWINCKSNAIKVLRSFIKNCPNQFGLAPLMKNFVNWESHIDGILNRSPEFDNLYRELISDISLVYLRGNLPISFDVSVLDESISNLRLQANILLKITTDIKVNGDSFLMNLDSLNRHIQEGLPDTAKHALHRIFTSESKQISGVYPELFGLKNIDQNILFFD